MPKLSFWLGFSRRSIRSATVASSIALAVSLGLAGLAVSPIDCRAPNSLALRPIGIRTNWSWELPKNDPFFSFTPTTRTWLPATVMTLSSGSSSGKSLSATSQPMSATGRFRSISAGVTSRPRSTLYPPNSA